MPLPAVYAVRRKAAYPHPRKARGFPGGMAAGRGDAAPGAPGFMKPDIHRIGERSSAMKFVCPVCGYVFDEAQEKAAFSSLPETWQCPICKAAKSLFTPQGGEAPAISGEPAQAEELRPLTPGELAAVFSNLARGCEKQYHPEEEARFQELAAYFTGLAPQEPDASVAQLLALFQEDLAQGYPAYQAAAQAAGDRGSQRVRVWGEKVTTMVRSLLEQYLRQGEDFLKNTQVWVCTVCGFVYVGDVPPELCPVCKVPAWKFEKVEGRKAL